MIARLFWTWCFCIACASVGLASTQEVPGFVQISASGDCYIDQKAIHCDRVPRRLRAMHLSRETQITLVVDDAPYEPVAAMLDSLKGIGFKNVSFMPSFLGTNPSSSVTHWIKLVVEGVVNHPFAMAMISTEKFKTWRETLIVLPPEDFTPVDESAKAEVIKADCLQTPAAVPMNLRGKEQRLWLFRHADGLTQSCLLPSAATSCDFLLAVMGQANIHWGLGDLEAIRPVASEIGCKVK